MKKTVSIVLVLVLVSMLLASASFAASPVTPQALDKVCTSRSSVLTLVYGGKFTVYHLFLLFASWAVLLHYIRDIWCGLWSSVWLFNKWRIFY